MIAAAKEKDIDYYSNTLLDQFPDGQDIEIFKFSALEYAWKHAKLSSEREHVTPFIKNNSSFKGKNLFKSTVNLIIIRQEWLLTTLKILKL